MEVSPDGPRVRIWTRLVPICRHSIDPTETLVRAYAVTYPETYWWESAPTPLYHVRASDLLSNAVSRAENQDAVDQGGESGPVAG